MAVIASWRLRAILGLTLLLLLLGIATRLDPVKEGLAGQYFFTADSNSAPVHGSVDAPPSTDRLGSAWNPPVPNVFSATWNGALLVLRDDLYTFATVSDDGSHLYVDGQLVVDNGGAHGPLQKTGSMHLTRGVHAIFVDYNQQGGAYRLDLLWSRGPGALEPLPASVLATRRTGVVRFVGSVVLRRALAAIEWIWVATVLAVIGRLAVRALLPVRNALTRDGTWPALRWILLGSAVLNLAGIWWGLPGNWVAIEVTPRALLDGLALHYSHGWFDAYPPFHYYLLSTVISPTLLLTWLGRLDLYGESTYTLLMLSCRLVSIAAACGIVIAVCMSATRAFGPRAGVLAAAVFALVAPFVYYAKTANVDVPYIFWFAVSMVIYLRLLDRLRMRDFVLFAICATLSVCTKDQAYGMYLLMPLPIVAQIARANRQAGIARPLWRALVDRRLIAAALTAAVLFAVIHNLAFNLGGFRDHVAFILGPGSMKYQAFDATVAGRLELARLSMHLIQESFGWPFFVVAGIGLGIAALSRRLQLMTVWLVVPAVSYYFGFIDVVVYNYDRFVLPICFVLAMFAGLGLDRFVRWGQAGRYWRSAVVACAFAYTLLYSATVDVLMIGDSRYAVEHWLAAHVERGDLVGSIFGSEYLPRLQPFRQMDIGTVEDLHRRHPSFYVLNADYARAVHPDSPTGELVSGLEQGTLGYRRVLAARRTSPWPWLVGAHPDLTGPRPETRVFSILRNINPTIEVFQRVQ